MLYTVFYVCDEERVEAIKTFSVNRKFKWSEQGAAMASWKYLKIASVEKRSIGEVKKQYSELVFDKKHRTFQRTINIGDVVVCENEVLVYTPVGWLRVPEVVWERVKIVS